MIDIYKGLELLGLNAYEINLLVEILDSKLATNEYNNIKYKTILKVKTNILKDILSGNLNNKKLDKILISQSIHFFIVDSSKTPGNDQLSIDTVLNNLDTKLNKEEEIINKYALNTKDKTNFLKYKNRLEQQNRILSADSLEGFETEEAINEYLLQYKHLNITYVGNTTVPFIYKAVLVYKLIEAHIEVLNKYLLQGENLIKNSTKIVELLKNAAEEVKDFQIVTKTILVSKEDANDRIKKSTQLLIDNIKELIQELINKDTVSNTSLDSELKIERDFALTKHLFI